MASRLTILYSSYTRGNDDEFDFGMRGWKAREKQRGARQTASAGLDTRG